MRLNINVPDELDAQARIIMKELGYTPTTVVRELYEFIAAHGCLPWKKILVAHDPVVKDES